MIFRNSILSIIRSIGKTALFVLLIFALTLALGLGASVWASVAQFLIDCDDYYTTIGLIEYMGASYPDDTAFDPALAKALISFEPEAISNDDTTLKWETPARSLGYIEGFWRTDTYAPDRMLSVLVVGNISYDAGNDVYNAIVMKALYSSKSEDNSVIIIDGDFGTFEPGHYYLVFGEVYRGRSPLLRLRQATYDNALAATKGVEIPHLLDITSDATEGQSYVIPEASVLVQIADTLSITNNSVLITGTNDLMSLLPFHQQELYIVKGRVFTDEEYARGSRVVIVSELLAARLGAGVGDSINLSVAVSDRPGIYNSYWAADGFSYSASFTVTGIMNTVNDKSWYVYVPESAGVPSSQFPVGYTVGQAVIRNEDAAAFSARVESVLDDRFHLTVYDQGYSTVAVPYQTIQTVAMFVTGVCGLVELAVLTLFGFLFVYRQRETSETMRMLGTRRLQVCTYFLYSAGLISLIAAGAGAAAGYRLHAGIITSVARSADMYALIDSRYSNGNLTITRTLEFAPALDWRFFLSVGAAVFMFAIFICLVFVVATFLHTRPSQRKPAGPWKEHTTSFLGGGSMKFAVLSILRGGTRSLIVPILAVAVVVFFGLLATTVLRYQEQLEAINDHTTIQGYYTDIHGKQVGNQVLNAYDVAVLYRTGMINNLSVSISEPYYYLGANKRAGGPGQNLGPLYVPLGSFAYESLVAEILRGPDLTASNDIRRSPEFFYTNTILMKFMDGYDETILAVPPDDPRVFSCIIPTSLMAKWGILFGDTVRVAVNHITTNPEDQARIFQHIDLLVVGSYEKQGNEDTIYVPLSLHFNTGLIWDPSQTATGAPSQTFDTGYELTQEQKNSLQARVFHSAVFTLTDPRALVAFKDYLTGYGYSQVQQVSKVREFIVLQDAVFNNSVASIKQQIRYINLLYPFLYGLVGIMAGVVSYLLIVSRKQEFAIMRGLGGTRTCTFFSFFIEQSTLCVFGAAAGLSVWRLVWGSPVALHLMLAAGFLACYFLGCAVSIMMMNQTQVLTILLDKD